MRDPFERADLIPSPRQDRPDYFRRLFIEVLVQEAHARNHATAEGFDDPFPSEATRRALRARPEPWLARTIRCVARWSPW